MLPISAIFSQENYQNKYGIDQNLRPQTNQTNK
jgi:hypothetical protein